MLSTPLRTHREAGTHTHMTTKEKTVFGQFSPFERIMCKKKLSWRRIRDSKVRVLVAVVLFWGSAHVPACLAENFTVGYLTNIYGTNSHRQGLVISGAINYALHKINSNESILGGHHLKLLYSDTMGDTLLGTNATIQLWKNKAIAIFGPEDSCEVEATVAAALNLPMISYKCADSRVSRKDFYKTFARTYPSDKGVVRSILALLKYYRWYKFSIISESTQPYETVARSLEEQANKHTDFKINHKGIKFYDNFHQCCEELKPCCNMYFGKLIEETYRSTRVYVFFGRTYELIQMLMMLQMKKLLDNGEYVIIYVDLVEYAMNMSYRYFWSMRDDSDVKSATLAARSLLAIVPSPPQDHAYSDFEDQVRAYNKEEPFNFPNDMENKKHITEFAAYLYDSVMLYAEALSTALKMNEDPRNGTFIIEKIISKKRYKSVTGAWTNIDENGDVEGNYTLIALKRYPENLTLKGNSGKQFSHLMLPIAVFQYDQATKETKFSLRDVSIDWIGGSPPPDEPPCSFDGSLCLPPSDIIREVLAGVLIFTFVIVSSITWVCYKNWKYEQEIAGLLWKIAFEEIQRYGPGGIVSSNSKTSIVSQMSLESKGLGQVFTQTALYKGTIVATKSLRFNRKSIDIQRKTKKEMKIMRELHHDNINQFIGACLQPNSILLVTEYCSKGSLQDILENDDIKLDHMFIASLVFDLIKGMMFLHESDLKVHGNLKSSNCVVTSRWVLQVTDFGLRDLYLTAETYSARDYKFYKDLLWNAPEILRDPTQFPKGTQKGDVYAFAIILHEIFVREGPFGNYTLRPDEIVHRVKNGPVGPFNDVFRPSLDGFEGQDYIRQTMMDGWSERPENRPDFRHIRERLHKMKQGMKSNIMDNMMAIMEKYANNLEELVDERTALLVEEKKKTESLLHRMLPKSVAEQLMRGVAVIPESFDAVTIYFSDIVGFTEMSASSTPMQVVTFLNDLYTVFDSIIGHYDVYKVETIGDAYMVVSGLPIRNGDNHAGEITTMALELLEAVKNFRIQHMSNQTLKLRIGVHTGPVVAGVVGLTMPRYCLFGDTVNTASRMESNGEALKIHISDQCKQYLERLGGYEVEERGMVKMKGKGELKTYWLLSRKLPHPTKSHPKDLILPQPLFTMREPDGRRRSPKLEYSRRGSLAIRGDSGHVRNSDDLVTSVSNGSVPGIPVFLRVAQDSPMVPKRFSPQVNSREGLPLKNKDSFNSRDFKVTSCDCYDDVSPNSQTTFDVPTSQIESKSYNLKEINFDCATLYQERADGSLSCVSNRRHKSGGDYRNNTSSLTSSTPDRSKTVSLACDELSKPLLPENTNGQDGKRFEIADRDKLKTLSAGEPTSKRWRSCEEIDLPKVSKASLKDWFANLFNNKLPESEVCNRINTPAGLLRSVREREKEESVV